MENVKQNQGCTNKLQTVAKMKLGGGKRIQGDGLDHTNRFGRRLTELRPTKHQERIVS